MPRLAIELLPPTPSTAFQTSPRETLSKYFNDNPRAPITPRITAFGVNGHVEDQIRNMIVDFEDISNAIRTNTDELLV